MSGSGNSYLDKAKAEARKGIRINMDYEPPVIKVEPPNNLRKKFYCCMCGEDYTAQKGYFPSGGKNNILWKGNNGYLPFCRKCCDILAESLVSFYSGNEEHAMKHLCCMFGWYYSEICSSLCKGQINAGGSYVSTYVSKLGTAPVRSQGKDFLSRIIEDYKESLESAPAVVTSDDVDATASDGEFVVTKEMIRKWGRGFMPDEYQFLEEEYADWVTKNVCNTKSQEELFKNIALTQLDVMNIRRDGGDASKALDSLQKLMGSASVLPKQNADNILADTQTFGTLLKKYEETAPIPEPSEEWKDVDGIRKYMNAWFRGGLAKALKINTPHGALYDEMKKEYEKYTVTPNSSDDNNASNDTSIFDAENNGGEAGGSK